jgi:LuxR family transcriptional regulator, regulator of acetate metabolism
VRDVLDRLLELGPVSELLERAPEEAALALDLDRVLLSRVEDGTLVPESLYVRGSPESAARDLELLARSPVKLDYPLVEGEVLRRRRPQLVKETDPPGRRAYAEVMGWRDYLTAPIVVDGRVIGFFHADRLPSGRPLDGAEEESLGTFALCFVLVFERAVLRRRLRVQHQEMRQVASWADARTSELSDGAITLVPDGGTGEVEEAARTAPSEPALRDLLTRRELDVLELMVKGETNAAIARNLVVSQGTVKFHVKNILRKLHASNRAEATSRYLRLTLSRTDLPGAGVHSDR